MITFVKNIITETAEKSGIPKEHVLFGADNSIIIPKPALAIEFIEEAVNKSGYNLAININKETKKIKRVLSLYEVRLPVICNLYALNSESLMNISDNFIKQLPRKLSDGSGNIVKIKAVSSKWEVAGGSYVGLKKIEPVIERQRLIKIDVLYHITEETNTAVMERFLLNGKEINLKGDRK